MSLTIIRDVMKSGKRMRNLVLMAAVVLVGVGVAVTLAVTVSAPAGLAFMAVFAAIYVLVYVCAQYATERHAIRLNGQGMRVKKKILVELIMQGDYGDRRLEYVDKSGRLTFAVTDIHRSETPHYHCWYTTYDESELRQRGIVSATTQAYFIRTDNAPIMKTMRLETHNVRTGKSFSPGAGPRGEQVDHYDVVADDAELTELLQILRSAPVMRP